MSLSVCGSSPSTGAWSVVSCRASPAAATDAPVARRREPSADDLEAQGYRLPTDSGSFLIESATGLRIGADYDSERDGGNSFAAQIATDRRLGRLSPNQEVGAVHLKEAPLVASMLRAPAPTPSPVPS